VTSGIGYLLPGQGAQAVGMGRAFYDHCPESREIYQRANKHLGFDVTALCFEGPVEELTKTERCQPALFVTSVAAYAAFAAAMPNLKPIAAAGLSLGEVTALAIADAFTLSDALYLVQARANAMAECEARHRGTMLAVIGLPRETIDDICRKAEVVGANFNAADQVVLSGAVPGIATAEELAKAAGAKRVVRLDVAGAFHSPLMQDGANQFKKALEKVSIATPRFPVVSNVTAQPVTEPSVIRDLLVKQIVSPVLWDASMQWFVQHGVTLTYEFPPARVLTALLRSIKSSVKGLTLDEPSDFDKLSIPATP